MIVKKLLVPFVNTKLLQQAEYCYVATPAISEAGFDFFMSKVSPKCKVDIVTGLDLPTSPAVLRKISDRYRHQVALRIYTRNLFHASVYAFDLPYRKRMAFIGSGEFTLGGLLKNEELSYQVKVEKEAEDIKLWFARCFEEGIELTDRMINEYEVIYPLIRAREVNSARDKKQFIEAYINPFNWNDIDLSKHYFIKEDYLVFENLKALMNTDTIQAERLRVWHKLLALHEELKTYTTRKKIYAHFDPNQIVSSVNALHHMDDRVSAMWLSYSRSEKELKEYNAAPADLLQLQLIIRQHDFSLLLMPGQQGSRKETACTSVKKCKKKSTAKSFSTCSTH